MLRAIYKVYRFLFARKALYNLNVLVYRLALRGIGILNHDNDRVSGEEAFLRTFLANKRRPIVLDVGANVGEYATKIMKMEPTARVYAFEPHPSTYLALKEASQRHGFACFNSGCGSENGRQRLYDYAEQDGSKHASFYKQVIEELHRGVAIEHAVDVIRLDDFVREQRLAQVDLLKIDTEGSELDVLRGLKECIDQKKIKAIHLEFNEMNVAGRVFFKDFWELLHDYDFNRMMPDGLVPIPAYSPVLCEIFAYQNIVAFLKTQ